MPRCHRKIQNEFPILVTARCNNREHFPVPLPLAWEIFSDYMHLVRSGTGIRFFNFLMMPNHIHLVCLDPEMKLSGGMAIFMRETSKEMGRISGRINSVWGNRFHSSILEHPVSYFRAYKYVYRNPVAAAICPTVEEYQWSSLRQLLGLQKGTMPLDEDLTLFSDVPGTLRWLNSTYSKQEIEYLQAGFARKVTKFAKEKGSRNSLYEWDSLPFAVSPKHVPGTL